MPLTEVSGLHAVPADFDLFLVDVWGVLHDGKNAYPGAIECLRQLKRDSKRVVIFSNAARKCEGVAAEVAEHGITPEDYDHIVSSGELVWQHLVAGDHGYGLNCYYLGPDRSRGLLEGPRLHVVEELSQSDFILNAGAPCNSPDALGFTELLAEAVSFKLPMLCANPDQVAVRHGIRGISAGAIARLYEQLGGHADYLGKPYAPMYDAVRAMYPDLQNDRILAVGDGLETDIRGGIQAGISTLLITEGIHRTEIFDTPGGLPGVCERYHCQPQFHCGRFNW